MSSPIDDPHLTNHSPSTPEVSVTHALNLKIEEQVKQIRFSSLLWSIATLAIFFTFYIVTLRGKNGDSLLDRTGADLLYRLRSHSSQEIKPSEKLKIFLFEDQTVGRLGATELKISQWDQLIRKISERKPAAIYIDRVFSVISEEDKRSAETYTFLNGIESPVYSAAFVSDNDLPGRSKIPKPGLLELETRLDGYFPENTRQFRYSYGAAEFLSSNLQPGHVILVGEMNFLPFVRISDGGLIPHLGIRHFIHDTKKISQIPTRDGLTTIRYISIPNLINVSYPLYTLVGPNAQNAMINEGDHVLIVPAAYTGNVDYKDTPVGRMIGGYYVASILNSAITGTWLFDYGSGEYGVYALLLIGFFLGFLRGFKGSLYSVVAGLTIAVTALILFCYFEILVPWLQLSTAIAFAGTVVGGLKSREQAARAKLLGQVNAILTIDNQIESERKQHLLRERREAIVVAQTFKPEPLPKQVGVIAIHNYYESADEASGDWYFVRPSPSGDFLHVLVCDVVGHGMHAAMIVACCKATLSTMERTVPNFLESMDAMSHYLRTVNDVLFSQGQGQHCTTVCALSFNQTTRETSIITCGHPPVIRIQKTEDGQKTFTGLSSRSDPIGLNHKLKPKALQLQLTDKDSLLLYTDGLPVSNRFAAFKKYARTAELNQDFPIQVTRHLWNEIFDRTGERCKDDISVILCVVESEPKGSVVTH